MRRLAVRAARSLDQLRERVAELRALAERLAAGDAAAAAVEAAGPAPGDDGGAYLAQLLDWRRLRQAAVGAELERLQRQLGRFGRAGERWMAGGVGLEEL